ncbi:MAG: zinc-ribbon domain-containing protein [Promethearchaeota archaeon]
MSFVEVSKEFSEYGHKMKLLGVLVLADFFVSIVSLFILYISYISWAFIILQLYFVFSALKNIKYVAESLNNPNLHEYRFKWINGFIVRFIGGILTAIGGVSILAILLFSISIIFIIIFLIGLITTIVGAYFEWQAWRELILFFEQNRRMFPEMISYDARRGANYMKNAAICDMLFFLIITALIAFILRVAGYFKLAKLEDMKHITVQPEIYQPQPSQSLEQSIDQPIPIGISTTEVKYCPHCGSEISALAKFCGSCGSKLEQ